MPRVEAWQCKHTGKLFPIYAKTQFKTHQRRALADIKRAEKKQREEDEFEGFIMNARNTLDTPEKISAWLMKNYALFYRRFNTWGKTLNKSFEINDVFISGAYSALASNSHSSPNSGQRNWGGQDGIPKGYPAYKGRISIKTNGKDGWESGIFDNAFVCVRTGSGGGGLGDYDYDVTLWLDDWPALNEKLMPELVYRKLMGQPSEGIILEEV